MAEPKAHCRRPSLIASESGQELLAAGHFWGPGSLPAELGDLVRLALLDLSGLPHVHDWLRDPAARRRHSLGPARDSSRVTLQVRR